MSFINWGSESPEQLAIRRRLEEQAIYEQAVRVRLSQAAQVAGVGGGKAAPGVFVSVWNTAYGDGNPTVELPLISDGSYDFTVDWGDGTTDKITAWDQAEKLHTYLVGGTYTIEISGKIEGWSFIGVFSIFSIAPKLIEINKLGQFKLGNKGNYFNGCENLTTIDEAFDLTGVTTMNQAFNSCSSLEKVEGIESWDVSSVTNMNRMFSSSNFNGDISAWDVSSVTTMDSMFFKNVQFNRNISAWDVSSVTNMNRMFNDAASFNQDLSSWCVINIPTLPSLFLNGTAAWTLPKPIWGTCPS